jgi:Meiotic cell cortex C-terminal pleckstrin homology
MISPSSSHLASPVHNRSIVVLTPTQAIKFTALSRESHIAWLTALDFLVHNDPADLVIPRGISTSPSNGSLWPSAYAPSRTASSIASSSQGPSLHSQLPPPPQMPAAYSYAVHKNASLSDYESSSRSNRKEDPSPLGHKLRYEDQYATPPLVPRIPTGRRFEGHGRSGSGSGHNTLRDWEETGWLSGLNGNGETIRMDAFVKRTAPRLDLDIDHTLFREF